MSTTPLYDVVGIGRAYIDIISPVSLDFLKKWNITTEGSTYYTDVADFEEFKKALPTPIYYPGGTMPNTLSGLNALGSRTGYFGKIGHDHGGKLFEEDLKKRNIDPLAPLYVEGAPLSGTCVVLLTDDGQRSFALHKGCVDDFTDEDFLSFDFNQARQFIVGANLLHDAKSYKSVIKAVERAAASSCKIVFSTSQVFEWETKEEMATDIIARYADTIIGNEIENKALFEITGDFKDTNKLIVTTLGEKGSQAYRGKGVEVNVEAEPLDEVVSSLGAGDQFLAGFLHGENLGLSLEESLRLGGRCAAAILKETEARPLVGVSWKELV